MKKVIFLGFGKLGKDCLEILLKNNYEIKYILTHKEKKAESVDAYAEKIEIPYSYGDLRKNIDLKDQIIKILEREKIDYLISINYRYIIPKEIFSKVEFPLNIHGSLLPKYRGRTPHVWNIINGEKITGITCHKIEETVDTGDIILQEKIKIKKDWTGNDLLKQMQEKYPILLLKSLFKIERGEKLLKQEEESATYFGKRIPEMGYISFYNSYEKIHNFIRAQAYPYPGAYYYLENGNKIIIDKIKKSNIKDLNVNIGKIVIKDDKIYVKCDDSIIEILEYRFDSI